MSLSYGEELAKLQLYLEEESKTNHHIIMHIEGENEEGLEFATCIERDQLICWLHMLTRDMRYRHEVFYRSTSLLDNFLSTSKVKVRYVKCAMAACFFIAAKLEEETESVLKLLDVLVDKYSLCSKNDIIKMEFIVMTRLECHLTQPTLQDFISIFYSLAISSSLFVPPGNLNKSKHHLHLYQCGQHMVCHHQLMKHRFVGRLPTKCIEDAQLHITTHLSMLALAILGCSLKLIGCDWLSTILSLQTIAQVRGGELSICYEAVAAEYPRIAAQYPLVYDETPPKPMRRKWRHVTIGIEPETDEHEDTDKTDEDSKTIRPTLQRTVNIDV